MADRVRKPLSAGKKLGFGCMTLLILLGAPELAFRIREEVRSRRKPRLPLQHDDFLILSLVPGASFERTDQGRRIDINSLGFRGDEIGEKDPARPRIYCAGGSTTFGLFASSNDATWPARLRALLEEAGQPVETINGGAPGWTSRTSMTNLELKGFALQPDVLIVYHNWNDLISGFETRYIEDSHAEDIKLLFRPEPTPLLERSAMFRFLKSRFRDPYEKLKHKEARLSEEGCQAYERNLRRLVRRGKEQGVRVVLCTFPTCLRETEAASREDQVPQLEQWYGAGSPMTYPFLYQGVQRYNEIIREIAADMQADLVDMAPTFPMDVSYYVSPLHHSDKGEEVVAMRLRDALLQLGILDQLRKEPSGER